MDNDYKIKIIALGGLGEVGKNTYVFEIDSKIFIVDAGILFPDSSLLGIDYVIPDYTYLVENQERIQCLIITHGHEDHIGGIPFLYKKVFIPVIYASGIAIDLIENKITDDANFASVTIEEFKSSTILKFGEDLSVSFIRLNHSIPDSFAVVFNTKIGSIIHTGDFKIDLTPVGPRAEYEKLTALNGKCLCLLSDSTNATVATPIQSESRIGDNLNDMFSHIEGRIIIVTFASNIYRIQQIIDACVKSKRKMCVFGKSMESAIEAGKQSGYIKAPDEVFVKAEMLYMYKNNQIALLCTGSQGEPLAALSRIALGIHRFVKPERGDTVIFSSSPIPGNQESINKTVNLLFKRGCEVIVNSPISDTHTSGHGSQNDLKLMMNLVNPKFFIPVHGERHMLNVHRTLAIECKIPADNILIMDNGEVAVLTKNKIYIDSKVQSGDIYVDGTGIGDIGATVIGERKVLSEEGVFAIAFSYSSSNKTLLAEPSVVSRGFIYMKSSTDFTNGLTEYAKSIMTSHLDEINDYNQYDVKRDIELKLQDKIKELTLRTPIVIAVLVDLDKEYSR
ncbi:MAG: ribonuclease J [Acholeplasmatales bacterium]|jgi:ribonuclease J|nr:ribonuclease J [Acholeplasmatales bacterium]